MSKLSPTEWRTLILDTLDEILVDRTARSALRQGISSLNALGLSSLVALRFTSRLGERGGVEVPITAIYAHPTLEALAANLASSEPAQVERAERSLALPRGRDPIAIVGMALRVPGAATPDDLWSLLLREECRIRPMSEARLALTRRLYPAPGATRQAGYLDEITAFDPAFFTISPAEAEVMDPQQRLALMVSVEALEDAGLTATSLARQEVGVFFGAVWHDYAQLLAQHPARFDAVTATGASGSIIANRVSYSLGFTGPSLVVDSACSSSLVAAHLACRSLASGDCRIALVGGVNVALDPATTLLLERFGGLSPNDRIRAFDAGADGFARGEGCCVLVLRPLRDALADNQPVYAVILGSAVNNDGTSHGLTAPSPEAQARVIGDALREGGVDPIAVDYVEAHGTGTRLGDPIEAAGIHRGYRTAERAAERPLRIGSLKPNLGHLEAAAGVAGLAKAALAVQRRELPPSIGFNDPNPSIPFEEMRLRVQREREPLAMERPMGAGVSSFGWGGTNAHVVLREAERQRRAPVDDAGFALRPADRERPFVVVFAPQGGQWPGMLRGLLDAPLARATLEEFDASFARVSGRSILRTLPVEGDPVDFDVCAVQPLIVAFQVTVFRLLAAWNVAPDVVVGHSLGEIAAAHCSGALTLEETAKLVHWYSHRQQETSDEGGMAICGASADELAPLLSAHDGVVIGGYNAPGATILSGPRSRLQIIVGALSARARFARMIPVNRSVHSAFIDAIRAPLHADLAFLRPSETAIDMVSTCTGALVRGSSLTADYWFRNLRDPVRYYQTLQGLCAGKEATVLEIGPHPILTPSNAETLRESSPRSVALGSHARGEDEIACIARLKAELEDRLGLERRAPKRVPVAVALSSHSRPSLSAYAEKLATFVESGAGADLDALAYTLNERRDHRPYRAAIVVDGAGDLAAKLRVVALAATEEAELEPAIEMRPAFIFSGQGSQWVGMGREAICDDPAFRESVLRTSRALERHGCLGIASKLLSGAPETCADIDVVQPAIFCLQIAYAQRWRAHGIEPRAVVGHSMGEVAAAHVAGILSLDDACAVITWRSRLLRRIRGRGAMLLTELGFDAASAYLTELGGGASLAAFNSPSSCVFAGPPDALSRLEARLDEDAVFNRRVNVDVASHTAQTDPLLPELEAALAGISPSPPRVPFYSSVHRWSELEVPLGSPGYWSLNLRRTVMFAQAVQAVARGGADSFVEVSPHPVLLTNVRQCFADVGATEPVALPTATRDTSEHDLFLESLAQAYERGASVNWRPLRRSSSLVRLPPRAWDLDLHLPDLALPQPRASAPAPGLRVPPLVLPRDEGERFFLVDLDASADLAALSHDVEGERLLSAAGFLAVIRANLPEETTRRALQELRLHAPLLVRPGHRSQILLTYQVASDTIRLHARSPAATRWVLHASASLSEHAREPAPPLVPIARDDATVDFYGAIERSGYGFPACARIAHGLTSRGDETWATLAPPSIPLFADEAVRACAYLDGLFQLMLAHLLVGSGALDRHCYLVERVGAVEWPRVVGEGPLHGRARLTGQDEGGATFDLALVGADRRRLGGLRQVRLERIARNASAGVTSPSTPAIDRADREAVLAYLRGELGAVLRLAARRVSVSRPFRDQGLTSLMAVQFLRTVNSRLDAGLTPTATYNHPTLEALAAHVVSLAGGARLAPRSEPPPNDAPRAAPVAGADALEPEERLRRQMAKLRLVMEGRN